MRMPIGRYRAIVMSATLALALGASLPTRAGSGYEWVLGRVCSGGGYSADGSYEINMSIGQPEAGVMATGEYSLWGGFWGGAQATYEVYLPLLTR